LGRILDKKILLPLSPEINSYDCLAPMFSRHLSFSYLIVIDSEVLLDTWTFLSTYLLNELNTFPTKHFVFSSAFSFQSNIFFETYGLVPVANLEHHFSYFLDSHNCQWIADSLSFSFFRWIKAIKNIKLDVLRIYWCYS
jgi:hypothetical protein